MDFCEAFVFNENKTPPRCNLKKFNSSLNKTKNAQGKTFGLKYCYGNFIVYV